MKDYIIDLEKIKTVIDNLYDEVSTHDAEAVIEGLYMEVVGYLKAATELDHSRSVEKQKELLKNALKNKNEALEKIKSADLYLEEDRADFISLVNENNFDYAWDFYTNLDTAAREAFMDVLESKV